MTAVASLLAAVSFVTAVLPARALSEATRRTSLPPSFSSASVSTRTNAGDETPCTRMSAEFFSCGKESWLTYGPKPMTVSGQRVVCTWIHPKRDRISVVRYPWVARGALSKGAVEFALTDQAAKARRAPIDARVTFGEDALETTIMAKRGWQTAKLPDGPSGGTLAIEVSTEDIGMAHLCYRLR